MKPFITPEILECGKKFLRFQYENIDPQNIYTYFHNLSIIAYAMPEGHSLKKAWIFRLIFDNTLALEFSSACTAVDGWEEYGSLNIKLINLNEDNRDKNNYKKYFILEFKIKSIEKLLYEGDNFKSECGISINRENGDEILITTGIPPGSVSTLLPLLDAEFDPEFPIEQCKRELM